MDDTERDDAIRKVRKLLAWKTQDGVANEQEVMNALGIARKLIARHAITEDELLRADENARTAVRGSVVKGAHQGTNSRLRAYHGQVAFACGYICDVKALTGDRGRKVLFVGLPRDVAVAEALYAELCVTMRALARSRYQWKWGKVHEDYCLGFASRLAQRASELKQEEGLVLWKQGMLEQWLQDNKIGTAEDRRVTITVSGAYKAGTHDADGVDLGTKGIR